MSARDLTLSEFEMLTAILAKSARANDYLSQLAHIRVEPIDSLGSLRFVNGDKDLRERRPHRFIDVKGVVLDSDGVPVLLCPFEDESGVLYLFDVQKMGGGPIRLALSVDQMQVSKV